MNSKIPKRIIQVWGGSLDLPLFSKASAENIKLLNPEFEYLFFNDESMENFINEHFPEYRSVFDSFRFPIQRFDFFRYLAVYRLGGFYFDMDIFLASNLSELLNCECVFPFEELTINGFLRQEYGMDWEVGNYAFGATAGHPFIHAIIKNCIRAQEDMKWTQAIMRPIPKLFREEYLVFYTSGPGLVSRTLAEYPDAATQVKVLFPENVCDSKYWNHFGKFGVHVAQGNWRKKQSILRRWLIYAWESWERKKTLKEALELGGIRSLRFNLKT
ncbi:glycosyltransferase [Methylomicrobium sp. Wu6]|uniref:glycosyltransferase family 32 protein n=1 Tax=Methylomicrobium sp. Wu6 TaxID=3107928 RepID=UPI002DD6AA13|nr:glycosyltransferase [Methylomicrobium sp. Wu6]MEC4749588.1 glycosyltransferase [Methylomicrobium sp. Wu6]